ncbi:MAG: hypothetical protein AVDCRST_MAG68-4884 [uncultured Gemmatimonadetes bacterium]|uniref:TonB C-terminal domain-containing protein n=1 Tax=uncultured Gemmatimonadota bacterium TaxID=203437 RepID=A0A6J4MR42_9BACT|nr:MAG: hypothetical protein AVDCRST_MAG68-4884 [uncultured Gemmatimonadota bacterium]
MRVSAIAIFCLTVLAICAPAAEAQTSHWMRDTASVEYKARARSFREQGCTGCDTAVVVPPRLLNLEEVRVALQRNYPAALRKAGISGSVLIWMIVDSAGTVGRSEVGIAAPIPQFDTAAVRVVRRMRFSPARTRTGPTGSFVSVPITFRFAESASALASEARNTPAQGATAPPAAASPVTAPEQNQRTGPPAEAAPARAMYRSAGWVELRRDSSVSVSIDTRAIRTRGDTLLAWIELLPAEARAGQAAPHARVLTWHAMLCRDQKIRTLLSARYGPDGDPVGNAGRMNNPFEAPAPGSLDAFILQTVCTRYAPGQDERE